MGNRPQKIRSRGDRQPDPCSPRFGLEVKGASSEQKPISINRVGEYVLAFSARTASGAFTANMYGVDENQIPIIEESGNLHH